MMEKRAIQLITIYVLLLGYIGLLRIEDSIMSNDNENMKYIIKSAIKCLRSMILYRDVAGSFAK